MTRYREMAYGNVLERLGDLIKNISINPNHLRMENSYDDLVRVDLALLGGLRLGDNCVPFLNDVT